MLPCGNEILQEMNPPLQLQLLQINGDGLQHCLFDQNPTSSHHDDFFDQILSTTTPFPSSSSSSWSDPIKSPAWDHNNAAAGFHYDHENINLAPKLRQPQQHQINAGGDATTAMKMMMLMQQQMMLSAKPTVASAGGGNIIDGSLQAFYNGFADGSLQHPQASFGANYSPTEMKQSTQGSGSMAGNATAPEKPKQKVRARRGQATDPHSIAERLRRVRIAERMKSLQELVPNANKTDKASMLDEIIDYVKFLQLQVKVLSVSRLGGAAAVGPLVTTDIPSEGGGDCVQTSINGGSLPRNSDDKQSSTGSDNLTVTEHQVAKLMEEDMGSAMQYLQGKGLCLMPVSLASTISNVTCRSRNPMLNVANPNSIGNDNHLLLQSSGSDGPSSPNMSVLTVQSASMGNGGIDGAASVSKT